MGHFSTLSDNKMHTTLMIIFGLVGLAYSGILIGKPKDPEPTEYQLQACDHALELHAKIKGSGTKTRQQEEALAGCSMCMCLKSTERLTQDFQDGFGSWDLEYLPVLRCYGCKT